MSKELITATLVTTTDTFEFTTHNPATLNQMWGQVLSEMGQAGIVGEHTSEAGAFTPNAGDGGRTGVGNLSEDNANFQMTFSDGATSDGLSSGSQGGHAVFQSMLFGSDFLPPEIVEAQIDPIYPHDTHVFTIDIL